MARKKKKRKSKRRLQTPKIVKTIADAIVSDRAMRDEIGDFIEHELRRGQQSKVIKSRVRDKMIDMYVDAYKDALDDIQAGIVDEMEKAWSRGNEVERAEELSDETGYTYNEIFEIYFGYPPE